MLTARKTSGWKREYEIESGGRVLATFASSWWRSGGAFSIDGHEYTVRHNAWGAKYGMAMADGTVVATANRVGRKNWTVEAEGRLLRFRRVSMWTGEQAMVENDREVGRISRLSWWKGGATAELPDMDPALQVFVVAVVLTMWDNESTAVAAST